MVKSPVEGLRYRKNRISYFRREWKFTWTSTFGWALKETYFEHAAIFSSRSEPLRSRNESKPERRSFEKNAFKVFKDFKVQLLLYTLLKNFPKRGTMFLQLHQRQPAPFQQFLSQFRLSVNRFVKLTDRRRHLALELHKSRHERHVKFVFGGNILIN